jgi:hypothetical protein
MNIKRATWLRPFFQVFAAIAGVLLLTAPPSFFNYRLFWAAGMVTLMGGIYVLPYAIWPETQGGFRLKLKKFFIIVLLLVGAALFMSERVVHRFPYGSGIALLLLFATAYFAIRHLERGETSRN